LAIRDRVIYFEYDSAFIERGLELSPLRLPLRSGVQIGDLSLFEGLPGLFNDSLPDGWGRLLFDRSMREHGIVPDSVSPLDRLAHIGSRGMGALTYMPDYAQESQQYDVDLDALAQDAQSVLEGSSSDVLEELLMLNGSSAGARPKALIGFNPNTKNITHGAHELGDSFEPWLVKFANTQDGLDAGAIEYVYALMASNAGVDMMPAHLFPAKTGAGYFATKRFDRDGDTRLHTHTACGVLHSDFRTPTLDYQDLLTLTLHLTKDVRDVERMYRLGVFNVLSHNRDDHSKNFTFLMDKKGEWRVSPAYDLTFSSGPRGEQSTMVMGEGKSPSIEHLKALGLDAKISQKKIDDIISQTLDALSEWETLAKSYGISSANIHLIKDRIILS
jgi:serine/threonine-protein kinase HipA